ncbi:hypothetical protein OKJ48_23950 [Streptomyces kunmingensis]|uniref:Uncharacterized protein n=1 Tax=Streptomyces kunmingensis TaxID=68225 RepID=A0ABU6CGY7_9ACTN|nr:hypothetical protein [Streptomyces kunmingensis]MEB3963271.1 hypothetical protein [Streptomyces kunmingensis]
MTVFYCTKCATALTGGLTALPAVPDVDDPDRGRDKQTGRALSTVPRGRYAIDPGPWGAPFVLAPASRHRARGAGRELLRAGTEDTVSAGWRDSLVVHPDDVLPQLQPFTLGDNWLGCCGPTGAHGPNLACSCGSRLATWAADCMGPNELHLDRVRVYAWQQDRPADGR